MSYLKDAFEIQPVKGFIFVLLLGPFWYLSIYLLNHEFYVNTEIEILIVLSYVLSISSIVFNMANISMMEMINSEEGEKPSDIISVIGVSSFFLWFWKIVLLFIAYTALFIWGHHWYYYTYICIYFGLIILANIVLIIMAMRKKK